MLKKGVLSSLPSAFADMCIYKAAALRTRVYLSEDIWEKDEAVALSPAIHNWLDVDDFHMRGMSFCIFIFEFMYGKSKLFIAYNEQQQKTDYYLVILRNRIKMFYIYYYYYLFMSVLYIWLLWICLCGTLVLSMLRN